MNKRPREILYWRSSNAVEAIVHDAVMIFLRSERLPAPRECIDRTIARADRIELAAALAAGEGTMAYLGFSDCKICGVQLGCSDMQGWGSQWPEAAEHYILEHDVWTEGCTDLLRAVRGQR